MKACLPTNQCTVPENTKLLQVQVDFTYILTQVNLLWGSVLHQIQNGKSELIAYASKRLPEATRNYSITELELYGLAINIVSFSHLLKGADFDAIVDHLALTHIIKSKTESATAKIKRLLELIISYSFNLYHIEGKYMILSDFLPRQVHDDSNPHKKIPISFNMHNVLCEKYYNIGKTEKYFVQR